MTFSELLWYLGAALAFVALVFLLIGFGRTVRLSSQAVGRKSSTDAIDLARLRAMRRVDWKSSAGVLAVAVLAVLTGGLLTGPQFSEPSGNIAGGIVLITLVVAIIVVIVLFVRHATLSRALRELEK